MSAVTALTMAYLRLVDDPPVDVVDPSTGKGPEWGKASPVGLLVILLLAIAMFFLLRSMARRLKRVQDLQVAAALPGSAVPGGTTTAEQSADESPSAGRAERSESGLSPG